MINILFIEQFPNISGGQKLLLNIIKDLDKTSYSALVAIPAKGEFNDELEKTGAKTVILPIGAYSAGKKSIFDLINYSWRSIVLIFMTIGLIKRNNIGLVYLNAPRTFLWGTLAASICRVPIVWSLHKFLSGLELKICARLLKKMVNSLIVDSKSVADPFLREDPGLAGKVRVIYNGINLDQYELKNAVSDLRNKYNIGNNLMVVGYVGQLAAWKGVEDFIRAAKIVLENNNELVFLIVGDVIFGGPKERQYKDRLLSLASDLGIKDKVIFTGKIMDTLSVLAAIDVVVIPSIEPDPCPLILIESMAAGKAVIATAHGGPAELIINGVSGRLYPPKDIVALAGIMKELIADRSKAEQLGLAAKQYAQTHLSQKIFMDKTYAVLAEATTSA